MAVFEAEAEAICLFFETGLGHAWDTVMFLVADQGQRSLSEIAAKFKAPC